MATGRVPLPAFLTTALSTATLCAAALCTTALCTAALCTIALSLPAQAQDALAGIVSPLVGEKSADQIIPDLPFDAIPPLNFHEIVTHIVGGQRIAVTYCPLTNSAVVFDATDITFGNTGALFNNNVVMYDTDTRSFWSQMAAGSIHGDRAGEHLSLLPVVHTRFRTWREFFPDTKLLSSSTGYSRNYRVDPYVRSGYTQNTDIFFPQGGPVDTRRHPKEMVFGLARNGSALAYPYTDLAAQGVVNDRVNGDDIVIFYDDPARLAIGFSRRLGGRLLHFRASESIDDRSPLFEDVETRSTWTILGGAVAGELDGSQLVGVATYSAYWFGWSSFWLGSDIWDGQSLTPPDTAVAESTWGQVKNRN